MQTSGSILLIYFVFCVVLRIFLSSFCVLYAHCCKCFWIVHSWLPLRFEDTKRIIRKRKPQKAMQLWLLIGKYRKKYIRTLFNFKIVMQCIIYYGSDFLSSNFKFHHLRRKLFSYKYICKWCTNIVDIHRCKSLHFLTSESPELTRHWPDIKWPYRSFKH